jgi:hypothetical protein
MRHICILAGLVAFSPVAYAAPAATFILKDQEVIDSDPSFEAGTLRGKRLWLGDENGDAGSAKFIRKGEERDKVLLNEEFQSRLQLGYDQQATFLKTHPERLSDRAVQEAIGSALKDWKALGALEFYKMTEADFDNDGTVEQVIKVNAPRAKDDPYAGDARSLEGLFVLEQDGGQYQVEGKIVPKPASDEEPRTNIDLLAIGRNPTTGIWDFLVRAESQQWEKSESSFTVTVNGETTTSSSDRARSRQTQIDVYRLSSQGLAAYTALAKHSWESCFGSKCE